MVQEQYCDVHTKRRFLDVLSVVIVDAFLAEVKFYQNHDKSKYNVCRLEPKTTKLNRHIQ